MSESMRALASSFARIALVARLTLTQSLRSKLLASALWLSAACVAIGLISAQLSVFARARLVLDLGLGAMSLGGAATTVAVSLGMMTGEAHVASQWMLLTKPISRAEMMVGQYLGVLLTMAAFCCLVAAGIAVGVILTATAVPASLAAASLAGLGELAVTTSVAFLFSNVSTRSLAATFTGAAWLAGQFADELRQLALRHEGEAMGTLVSLGYELLPDYARLHLRDFAAAQMDVPQGLTVTTILYAALYSASTLIVAATIYSRRQPR